MNELHPAVKLAIMAPCLSSLPIGILRNVKKYSITLANLVEKPTTIQKVLFYFADRLLGIKQMDKVYQQHGLVGVDKETYSDKLLEILDVKPNFIGDLAAKIPQTGPVFVCANHPFGGLEGVILARAISQIRPDLKVLANEGLSVFKELQDYFIFINPLSEKDPKNGPALRDCIKHVRRGNALMMFPSGRVSYYLKDKQRIGEHAWNKIAGAIACVPDVSVIPLFIEGFNSPLFYRVGRVKEQFRLFMLGHELLNKRGCEVRIRVGNAVKGEVFSNDHGHQANADFCRALSYAHADLSRPNWKNVECNKTLKPIAKEIPVAEVIDEINALNTDQLLYQSKNYEAYVCTQAQCPRLVESIARWREIIFRDHDEGSGEPIDTDGFDATYHHLFVWDRKRSALVGAYRMGLTEQLQKAHGQAGLYLQQMFIFADDFMNQTDPCIELGRSFVTPDYQRTPLALKLLWCGIGGFITKHPKYQRLYGTVSISRRYEYASVSLINELLVPKQGGATARQQVESQLHPELKDYCVQIKNENKQVVFQRLCALVKSIEPDGKDVPILLKHYFRLNAEFHAFGFDPNFAGTPGLLLSLQLKHAPERKLKEYLGENYPDIAAQ